MTGRHPAKACARRRQVVGATLGERTALLAAGTAPARNYPGNPYPFRASSHFLYLVGATLPGAYVLCEGGEWTVFMAPTGPAHALWHGATPSLAMWAEALGLPVRPLDELAGRLSARVATLPPMDAATCAILAGWLGRAVVPGTFAAQDMPLVEAMVEARTAHDAAAIEGLREAATATAAAHRAGMHATRPGLREWTVRAAVEGALMERGMRTSFGSIVSVHGEVLHNEHHHGQMVAGELLLVDAGAETAAGWAGDVSRTWPVSGRFSATQRALYEVVLEAQRVGIEACTVGARYRDVHLETARSLAGGLVDLGILRGEPEALVADDVHALFFPHGVGHLLGLDVHDMEDLGDHAGYAKGRARSSRFGLCYLRLDRDLAAGMAVTIEPGFYQVPAILNDPERRAAVGDRVNWTRLKDFSDVRGIRLEDDVLVTAAGPEVLTSAVPKAPDEVEATVG